jgi:hypothetical protein
LSKFSTFPRTFNHRDPKDASGYIYVFSIGHDNLYKVGKSVDWRRRLKALRAASPQLKAVLDVRVKDRHKAETAVHSAIALHKVEREIFRLQETDIEKIRDILVRFVE